MVIVNLTLFEGKRKSSFMKRSMFVALMLGSILMDSSVRAGGDPAAAIVNGKEIKVSDIMAEMKGLEIGKDMPQEQLYKFVLDRSVDLILIEMAAEKAGVMGRPEVQKALKNFSSRLSIQYFISQEMKKAVTDAAVQEDYKKLPPQKEVKLSHIMVKDEKTAIAVIKALDAGTQDFATLAKTKSIDEVTGKKGGELGSSLESQLPPPFAEAVKELKPGGYTAKPVKTPMGYLVIKLDSRTDAPFESVAPMIREKLEKETLSKLIETLKKEAKVQLFDQEGKPLPESAPTGPVPEPKPVAVPVK